MWVLLAKCRCSVWAGAIWDHIINQEKARFYLKFWRSPEFSQMDAQSVKDTFDIISVKNDFFSTQSTLRWVVGVRWTVVPAPRGSVRSHVENTLAVSTDPVPASRASQVKCVWIHTNIRNIIKGNVATAGVPHDIGIRQVLEIKSRVMEWTGHLWYAVQ